MRLRQALMAVVEETRAADSFKLKKQTLYEKILFDNSNIGCGCVGAGAEYFGHPI